MKDTQHQPKRWRILGIVLRMTAAAAILTSCTSPASPFAAAYQASVDGIQELHASQKIPDHFMQPGAVRTGEEFDPNRYFDVLTHISMEKGYTLDYVYRIDDFGGLPILYARSASRERYPTIDSLYQDLPGVKIDDYLEKVQTDGSEAGFFELAVLRRMGGEFYLWWHAAYSDAVILCTTSGLEQIFSSQGQPSPIPADIQARARKLSIAPRIVIKSTSVDVELVYFSKSKGFIGLHTTFSRSFPHKVLEENSEVLIKYDSGVVY